MKKLFTFLNFLFLLTITNYAQISPHPDLLDKIKKGDVKTPYAISNVDLIRNQGVDAPWTSPGLQNKKDGILSRSFGPTETPIGSYKALVLLVKFTDNPSQVNPSYFDNLIF
ncbi:MAG TPA: hypothetical protein VLN45_11555, partial [Ignavibacteriaceae bacterium]|nr:hypothetical protein [Ignavibacteriaceae bacterium]